MNPTAILALIGDLYGQIADLTARNQHLEAEAARHAADATGD